MRKAHGDLGAYVAYVQDIYVLVTEYVGNVGVLFLRCHSAEAILGRFDVDKRPFTETSMTEVEISTLDTLVYTRCTLIFLGSNSEDTRSLLTMLSSTFCPGKSAVSSSHLMQQCIVIV